MTVLDFRAEVRKFYDLEIRVQPLALQACHVAQHDSVPGQIQSMPLGGYQRAGLQESKYFVHDTLSHWWGLCHLPPALGLVLGIEDLLPALGGQDSGGFANFSAES